MLVNQKPHKFVVKSLNIIDPLQSTNNLGQSVIESELHVKHICKFP